MPLAPPKPLPPTVHVPPVTIDDKGSPSVPMAWKEWFASVQATLTLLAAANFQVLANAANDGAAATAGVPVGGLYRNGNAVQIRLV